MGLALAVTVELEQFTCGECGGVYALAQRFTRQKRDDAGFWTCPYCKCSWGYGKGELQRAKEELIAEQERHRLALARANEAATERDNARCALIKATQATKRLRTRVQNGVCPCCNRTFQNLARHMATKHKDEK